MQHVDSSIILQQLVASQLLTEEQMMNIMQQSASTGRDALDIVQDEEAVTDIELTKIKSQAYQIPYVDLESVEVPEYILDVIPLDIAENYQLVPFQRDEENNITSIAFVDPFNFKAIEALDFISRRDGVKFQYAIATEAGVRSVLRQYENLSDQVEQALGAGDDSVLVDDNGDDEATQAAAQSAPVSKMISVIMRYAVEGNASDVHIEPDDDGTRVRYRVDGELTTSLQVPKKLHNALVARIKVLASLKLDETRLPQDGRFRMKIDGKAVDFRVSTMPLVGQEKVVLRILAKKSGQSTLEDLGYADYNLRLIQEVIKRPHGMMLITGPTGSGKSTTLNAILESLNSETVNIITLEDPVEYNIPGISQTQVRPEIDLTFARGLRAILRQDPDIIMVGEIRDNETAELSVHAALTGHMLFSTLHTNDAIGAIPRLIDMQIEPFLIASSLEAVVAQRLVRHVCQDCVEPMSLPVQLEAEVLSELERVPQSSMPSDISSDLPLKVYKGAGCSKCDNTGYKGRLPIAEVIEVTPRMEELIAAGKITDTDIVEKELYNQGMVTLKQDGIIKALRGLTTIEEVWRATQE